MGILRKDKAGGRRLQSQQGKMVLYKCPVDRLGRARQEGAGSTLAPCSQLLWATKVSTYDKTRLELALVSFLEPGERMVPAS